MRKVIELQMKLGEVGIKDIEFDLKSRDETTKLLIGIQSIYCDKETIDKAFEVLVELIPENVDQNNGRRGMDFWKIFVLGMLRLNCEIDFDKLHELA
ncbi:MAG: ISNCY family transposase, partial [Candidatus Brocadiaceae bacterium]|nr:ISNCY family transposase [Candidatus Brocadiaceae bacterium]